VSKKRATKNFEFLENEEYYKENAKKYTKENGWYISKKDNNNLIIPQIFKVWSDVVQEQLPQLKKLSPISQNLQIFTKQNKKTIKEHIKECYSKTNFLKIDIATMIAKYVSKYEAGLSDKEIKKMIEQKRNHEINRNLFQFSRSCKKLNVVKTLKYLPFDLQHPKYHLTSFYTQSILDFEKEHPFYYLLQNIILRQNNKKIIYFKDSFKNTNLEVEDFEKNKNKYLSNYIKQNGSLSYVYGKIYYSIELYDDCVHRPKYIKMCEKLKKHFNIDNLKVKKPFKNKKDKDESLTYFDNYINSTEEQLRLYC